LDRLSCHRLDFLHDLLSNVLDFRILVLEALAYEWQRFVEDNQIPLAKLSEHVLDDLERSLSDRWWVLWPSLQEESGVQLDPERLVVDSLVHLKYQRLHGVIDEWNEVLSEGMEGHELGYQWLSKQLEDIPLDEGAGIVPKVEGNVFANLVKELSHGVTLAVRSECLQELWVLVLHPCPLFANAAAREALEVSD